MQTEPFILEALFPLFEFLHHNLINQADRDAALQELGRLFAPFVFGTPQVGRWWVLGMRVCTVGRSMKACTLLGGSWCTRYIVVGLRLCRGCGLWVARGLLGSLLTFHSVCQYCRSTGWPLRMRACWPRQWSS